MKKEVKAFYRKNPSSGFKTRDLAKKLFVENPNEYAKLKDTLFKLEKEGYLSKKGKKYFLNKTNTEGLTGKLVIIKGGSYGFVTLKNSKLKDIFIPEKYLSNALNGDTAVVELLLKQKGKNVEGKIIEVAPPEKFFSKPPSSTDKL